jgi:hypothetical protein
MSFRNLEICFAHFNVVWRKSATLSDTKGSFQLLGAGCLLSREAHAKVDAWQTRGRGSTAIPQCGKSGDAHLRFWREMKLPAKNLWKRKIF